jgi:hypothetical protein
MEHNRRHGPGFARDHVGAELRGSATLVVVDQESLPAFNTAGIERSDFGENAVSKPNFPAKPEVLEAEPEVSTHPIEAMSVAPIYKDFFGKIRKAMRHPAQIGLRRLGRFRL